jgi:cytochrome d ubiquinol oxidase subunit I
VSGSVGGATVLLSMITFTLVYGGLGIIEIILLKRYVEAGPDAAITGILESGGDDDSTGDTRPPEDRDDWPPDSEPPPEADDDRLVFAY